MLRITIIAVGKLKDDAEAGLYSRYVTRLGALSRNVSIGPVSTIELAESKHAAAAQRKAAEAGEILRRIPPGFTVAALDERGKMLTTPEFTDWLRMHRDAGEPGVAFLLGGPDGHGAAAVEAGTPIALGRMTLPHGLARVILAEQLYRAACILSNHPYHRE